MVRKLNRSLVKRINYVHCMVGRSKMADGKKSARPRLPAGFCAKYHIESASSHNWHSLEGLPTLVLMFPVLTMNILYIDISVIIDLVLSSGHRGGDPGSAAQFPLSLELRSTYFFAEDPKPG